jgi:hypothetical protein
MDRAQALLEGHVAPMAAALIMLARASMSVPSA